MISLHKKSSAYKMILKSCEMQLLMRRRDFIRKLDLELELTSQLLYPESCVQQQCQSDSLSEEGLVHLFDRLRLTPGNHNLLSNYDFFLEACDNEKFTKGIIQCLLKYFPDAISVTDDYGWSPLHCACNNENVTLDIIRLLINAAPNSVCSKTNEDEMPLHLICGNEQLDEMAAIEILKLLIKEYRPAIRHSDNKGRLPIHTASARRSPKFCRLLIEANPGSVRMRKGALIIADANGALPLHWACLTGSLATVEYLYHQCPDAIHLKTKGGHYPIHYAIQGITHRDNSDTATAGAIVQFLQDCDPNQKLQQFRGESLLQFACRLNYDDSNINAALGVIKIIFDAHPEAIRSKRITTDIQRYHHRVQTFVVIQLSHARQAKDHRLMTTPDDNGQLLLHAALQDNVRLGSIKLLVKGNPLALLTFDSNFALPLHVACQHHDSAGVIQYLHELNKGILRSVEIDNNTALHYACRGAKYDTISMLLEKYDAASVSKRNSDGKLPIHLLWESKEVSDRESVEYTESVFRLLRANPEMFNQ